MSAIKKSPRSKSYTVGGHQLTLATSNGSMPPSPYSLFLAEHIPEFASASRVIDFGTGCGILGIVAARQGAGRVWCVDVAASALLDTLFNAWVNLGRDDTCLRCEWADLRSPVPFAFLGPSTKVDLIVCNPPSLPTRPVAVSGRPTGVQYDAGRDGRDFIDLLLVSAREVLLPGGRLLLCHSSIANLRRTKNNARALGYAYRVVAERLIPIRAFYDLEHLKTLDSELESGAERLIHWKCDGTPYETLSIVELSVSDRKPPAIASKL